MYRQYRDILSAGVFLRCGPEVGGSVAVMHINVIYWSPVGSESWKYDVSYP